MPKPNNRSRKALACVLILCASPASKAVEDLRFETVVEKVSACDIDIDRYRGMWSREDAILLRLPSSGTISGILVTQFYWAPGRNGSFGNYGVVFNAPIAQVLSNFPQFAAPALVNGFERHLVPLAKETGNPRNKSQTLLVCRGGTSV